MPRHPAVAALLLLAGCASERRYESACQIVSKYVVEQDDKGEPTQVDVEMEWDPCPGDQVQMVRGGADFAKCMAKWNPGDYVPVKVVHFFDSRGYWDWDLYEIGGCARPIESGSYGSYAKSRECSDAKTHGHPYGFDCALLPEKRLGGICPWMKRE